MMDFIRRMKQNIVADAIVCLVIGAVMLFCPGFSAELLCTVIAWMVILVGAFMVIDFFAKREEGFYSGMILGIGGIITVFGIILLTHVNSFILFIPKIFGIVILVSGVMNQKGSLLVRSSDFCPDYGSDWSGLFDQIGNRDQNLYPDYGSLPGL